MTKSQKRPDDVRIRSRKDIGKLRKAVDAYKKDTGKTPTIEVDRKTGQIVIRLGKGESALSFRLKYL
jgi:hypothetical protein